ncbi:MAG: hypothetical protein ACLP22_21170, partial [Solirubrobacteraceae bacterium]
RAGGEQDQLPASLLVGEDLSKIPVTEPFRLRARRQRLLDLNGYRRSRFPFTKRLRGPVPKPLSGSILTRRLADDTLVVDVKIPTERRLLWPASEWSEARARKRLETRLLTAAQLRQDWTALIPAAGSGCADGGALGPLAVRDAATDYVEALSRYENPNTVSAYRSPVVKHLLPFLAYVDAERTVDSVLAEVDEALMLRFVAAKQTERAVLQDIAETLTELDSDVRGDPALLNAELDAEEWRLLCRYGQRGGHHMVLDPSASGLISLSSHDPAASGCTQFSCRRCLTQPRRSTPTRRRTPMRGTGATALLGLPRAHRYEHPVTRPPRIDGAGVAGLAVRVDVALAVSGLRASAAAAAHALVAGLNRPRLLAGRIVEVRLDRRRRSPETVGDLCDREALDLAVVANLEPRSLGGVKRLIGVLLQNAVEPLHRQSRPVRVVVGIWRPQFRRPQHKP